MSYAFLTIKHAEDGRQFVDRPRTTDIIGHTLRGAFDATNGATPEILHLLKRLDAIPYRLN